MTLRLLLLLPLPEQGNVGWVFLAGQQVQRLSEAHDASLVREVRCDFAGAPLRRRRRY